MAVFNNRSIWNVLDNVVCVVTHVNDRLVVHIRKFKGTIPNNESQCRDNLIYLHLFHRNLFTKKTQECAQKVGHLHSANESINDHWYTVLGERQKRVDRPNKRYVISNLLTYLVAITHLCVLQLCIVLTLLVSSKYWSYSVGHICQDRVNKFIYENMFKIISLHVKISFWFLHNSVRRKCVKFQNRQSKY